MHAGDRPSGGLPEAKVFVSHPFSEFAMSRGTHHVTNRYILVIQGLRRPVGPTLGLKDRFSVKEFAE
jgi:hypothetical protein